MSAQSWQQFFEHTEEKKTLLSVDWNQNKNVFEVV